MQKKVIFWAFFFVMFISYTTTYKLKPNEKQLASKHDFQWFFVIAFIITSHGNVEDMKFKPEEIIEFACLKVTTQNYTVESTFQSVVKPFVNTNISEAVQKSTGIKQEDVDRAETFHRVYEPFERWLKAHFIKGKAIFVTFGNWYLRTMLPLQMKLCVIELPEMLRRWINLRKLMSKIIGHFSPSISELLIDLQHPNPMNITTALTQCKAMVWALKAVKTFYSGNILSLVHMETSF